jgi:inhibitor of cysteine peptidase
MGSGGPYVCPRLYRKLLSEFAKMLTKTEFSHPKLIAAAFYTLFALAGFAPAQAQMQTTQTVALSPEASTTIVLRENPSTGFRWRLNAEQSTNLALVRVIDRGYQAGQSGLIGAPGTHRWEIEARTRGTASVIFTCARPWERKPPAETHVVQVNIARSR